MEAWSGFMKGCPGVAIDTHVYQAWFDIQSQQSFLDNACSWRKRIRAVQVSWVNHSSQPAGQPCQSPSITLNVFATGEHVARACGRVVFSNGQLCDVAERFP